METLQNDKNSRTQEITWDLHGPKSYGTIVERHFEDEKKPKGACANKDTRQSDMEEFDRNAKKTSMYVASSDERAYQRGQHKVVQPYQGGGSDTMKTKEHPEYKRTVQWKREDLTSESSELDAEQWSSWSSWARSPAATQIRQLRICFVIFFELTIGE